MFATSALTALLHLADVQRAADAAIEARIDRLTPEQKVAQLLLVGFEGTAATPELRRLVAEQRVGGVVLYARNIVSGDQVRQLNAEIQRLGTGGIEPFIAIDQEGGTVERLHDRVPRLPGNMALGATRSPDLSNRAGRAMGASLRELGFTMNFAPVVDVLTEHGNMAIGNRSFSDDPTLVAELGVAFIEGQQSSGVASVAKHFPGQGGVREDSHYRLPVLRRTLAELRIRELVPFRAAVQSGVSAVMTSHMALPKIAETPTTPTTVSHRLLTHLLRQKLGFQGVVITDELQMRSIMRNETAGEAAVRAILAGADMILTVWDARDRQEILRTVLSARKSGKLTEARLRESLRRILRLKGRLAIPPTRIPFDPNIADEIARAALTIEGRPDPHVAITAARHIVYIGAPGALLESVSPEVAITSPVRIDETVITDAYERTKRADLLVAGIQSTNDRTLIMALAERCPTTPVVIVELGMPGDGSFAALATVTVYDDGPPAQRAAAAFLKGQTRAAGKLPLSTRPRFPASSVH